MQPNRVKTQFLEQNLVFYDTLGVFRAVGCFFLAAGAPGAAGGKGTPGEPQMGPRSAPGKAQEAARQAPGAAKRRKWARRAPERPKEAVGGFKGGAGTPKISPRKPQISARRSQEAQHEPKTAAGRKTPGERAKRASKGPTRKYLETSVGDCRPRKD